MALDGIARTLAREGESVMLNGWKHGLTKVVALKTGGLAVFL